MIEPCIRVVRPSPTLFIMSFYMTLPSNSSPDLYADNMTSSFKVQLAQRMELRGDWCVALMEVQYPNTLPPVLEHESWIKVYQSDACEADGKKLLATYTIPTGTYPFGHDFVETLRRVLTPLGDIPADRGGRTSIVEEKPDKRLTIHPFPGFEDGTFEFSKILALQLGLPGPGPFRCAEGVKATRPPDLKYGTPPQLFIYTNIIQDQIVGHTRAPLLRTVPTSSDAKYGSITTHLCDLPHYYPLSSRSFTTIEVDIRTHTGQLMPFDSGTLTLVCHFKRG